MPNADLVRREGVDTATFDTWIFDLDNTLYPPAVGLVDQMNARIRQYLCKILGLGDEMQARLIQAKLCEDHGTTLRGLMVTRGVDPAELLEFEHDIDYSKLSPNPRLATALATLPGRKFILTNSIAAHAHIVLERLGFSGIFHGVFDLHAADLVPKPHPETYRKLAEEFDIDPLRAVMVDDLRHNLDVPYRMGMRTIWLSHSANSGAEPRGRSAAQSAAHPAAQPGFGHPHVVIDDLAAFLSTAAQGASQHVK